VLIARFLCRSTGRTFSLLPCQLAPYHRYTIESMILALLLVLQVCREEDSGVSAALEEFPADSDVTPWLLAYWRGVVLRALRGLVRSVRHTVGGGEGRQAQ
jgi:hypothetical protein